MGGTFEEGAGYKYVWIIRSVEVEEVGHGIDGFIIICVGVEEGHLPEVPPSSDCHNQP
jgi:hypothetical protein